MPGLTRRIFVASLGCTAFLLSKPSDEKAFPSWTAEYVDRMLTNSPWAKESTVSFRLDAAPNRYSSDFAQIGFPGGIGLPGSGTSGSRIPGWPSGGGNTGSSPRTWPGGSRTGGSSRTGGAPGTGSKTEIYLVTRWSSALPIRRALALQEFGINGLNDEKAVELLNRNEPDYVVEIAGFPTTAIRQGAEKFAAELLRTARLTVPNRPPIAATASNVPEYGMHLVATLRFPRFENLAAKEGTIDLFAESGRMRIQERFKLREMVYDGRLEL
ncbi:MAG: hypothetical protein ABI972_08400 [Acidobacteriota bacterium]